MSNAGVPHRRVSPLRDRFLSAFPEDGTPVTKHEVCARLYCSDVRFRELAREHIDAGLIERLPAVAHGGSYTYPYRRREGARRGRGARASAIVTAERLLPNRYEGVAGYPGPIDQACLTCGAQRGVTCFNLHWREAAHRRGRRVPRARLERPHRTRRAWRGKDRGRPRTGEIQPAPITGPGPRDRACPRCVAERGHPCWDLRWTNKDIWRPIRREHPERWARWSA